MAIHAVSLACLVHLHALGLVLANHAFKETATVNIDSKQRPLYTVFRRLHPSLPPAHDFEIPPGERIALGGCWREQPEDWPFVIELIKNDTFHIVGFSGTAGMVLGKQVFWSGMVGTVKTVDARLIAQRVDWEIDGELVHWIRGPCSLGDVPATLHGSGSEGNASGSHPQPTAIPSTSTATPAVQTPGQHGTTVPVTAALTPVTEEESEKLTQVSTTESDKHPTSVALASTTVDIDVSTTVTAPPSESAEHSGGYSGERIPHDSRRTVAAEIHSSATLQTSTEWTNHVKTYRYIRPPTHGWHWY